MAYQDRLGVAEIRKVINRGRNRPLLQRWRVPGLHRRTAMQRKLRAARLAELRGLWRTIAPAVVGVVAFSVLWLALWPTDRLMWLVVGVLIGAFGMALVWVINGRVYNTTMGTWAEEWTSEVLRKRRGWTCVDNVPMLGFDIDHIAFAPAGILAVETKYYGPGGDSYKAERLRRDIAQARSNGAAARRLLGAKPISAPCDVIAVLMLWGVGVPSTLEPAQQEGVWIIHGNDAKAFLAKFDGLSPGYSSHDAAWRLREWVNERDRHEQQKVA